MPALCDLVAAMVPSNVREWVRDSIAQLEQVATLSEPMLDELTKDRDAWKARAEKAEAELAFVGAGES